MPSKAAAKEQRKDAGNKPARLKTPTQEAAQVGKPKTTNKTMVYTNGIRAKYLTGPPREKGRRAKLIVNGSPGNGIYPNGGFPTLGPTTSSSCTTSPPISPPK